MKILIISQRGDGLGLGQRMVLEGHEVAVWIKDAATGNGGTGIVERPASWREKLKWAELIVCDAPGMGAYEAVFQSLNVPYLACSSQIESLELVGNPRSDIPANGVRIMIGGFFNGRDWLHPFTHSFEEKRLFVGDLGPLTRGMGAVVLGRESNRLTKETIEKVTPSFVRAGWKGMFCVDCLVTQERAFVLETVGGFGFDTIEAIVEGMSMGLGTFLQDLADGTVDSLDLTIEPMISVRLSVSPYPYRNVLLNEFLPEDDSIRGICDENRRHLFLSSVTRDSEGDGFRLGNGTGMVLVATARGSRRDDDPLGSARRRVYRTLGNIRVECGQYRLDIGARVKEDLARLIDWGWIQEGEVL